MWCVQEPEASITTSSDSNSNGSAEREQDEAGCSGSLFHPSESHGVVCRTDSSPTLVLNQSVAFIPFWCGAGAAESIVVTRNTIETKAEACSPASPNTAYNQLLCPRYSILDISWVNPALAVYSESRLRFLMVINVQMTNGKWDFHERGVVIYYKEYEHLTHLFSQTCLITLP